MKSYNSNENILLSFFLICNFSPAFSTAFLRHLRKVEMTEFCKLLTKRNSEIRLKNYTSYVEFISLIDKQLNTLCKTANEFLLYCMCIKNLFKMFSHAFIL